MSTKWTRQLIIEQIRDLHAQGVPLSSRAIRKTHGGLYGAANYRIGSWPKAIRAAGIDYSLVKIPPEKRKRKYSPESVLRQIRDLHAAGVDISSRAIETSRMALYGRARMSFGSWKKAVTASGIDYSLVCKRKPFTRWSRKLVTSRIRERAEAGLPINMLEVKKQDSALYTAACRYFGNWGAATKDAGFCEFEVRKDKWWDAQRAVVEIKRRVGEGESISLLDVRKSASGLYCAAVRYHGSWEKAVEAAGFRYREVLEIMKWSKELVVKEIRARNRLGLPLNHKEVLRDFPTLVSRGMYHFGTWEAAVEAAGFSYSTIVKRWVFARRKSNLKKYER